MADRNSHRRHMPIISIFVAESMPMPGSTNETSRFKGKRIILHIFKWPQRTVTDIDSITINSILSTRSCILQIITSLMFQHARTFIPSLTRLFIILSRNFPTIFITMMFDQCLSFPNSLEAILRIYLHSHYGIFVRTSPIHIYSSIIVFIKRRIMQSVSQLRIYRFPCIFFRMSVFEYLSFPTRGSEVQCISYRKNRRSIIFQCGNSCTRNILPVRQIVGTPISSGLGGKQIIITFEVFQYRISGFTTRLVFRLKSIIQIDRVSNNPVSGYLLL